MEARQSSLTDFAKHRLAYVRDFRYDAYITCLFIWYVFYSPFHTKRSQRHDVQFLEVPRRSAFTLSPTVGKMIGISPTKCQLSADDFAEYEACKINWIRAAPKKQNAGLKKVDPGVVQTEGQRVKETRSRIGVSK